MSRKRSEAAIEAHHERFVAGAQRMHGVDDETAERVFAMVQGFSGFGFPKAHGAAFGLLAYQSTWLRVHYGAGVPLLAAERAADGLLSARRARSRGPAAGDRGARARRQRERGRVRVDSSMDAPGGRGSRIGLGYIRGVREQEIEALVAAREAAGAFAACRISPRGRGAARPRSSCWPGRERATRLSPPRRRSRLRSGFARRLALWQLGVATPGRSVPGGTQLALPLDLPAPPSLRGCRSGRRCSPTTARSG